MNKISNDWWMAPVGTLGAIKAQQKALLNQRQKDNEDVVLVYIILRSLIKLKHSLKHLKNFSIHIVSGLRP